MNRAMEGMGGWLVKRYRMYERSARVDSAAVPEPEPSESRELAEVRPLPVLAEPPEARVLDRPAPPPLPVVVAVGTIGFMAGVLAWTLVRVLRRPAARRPCARSDGAAGAGSRSPAPAPSSSTFTS